MGLMDSAAEGVDGDMELEDIKRAMAAGFKALCGTIISVATKLHSEIRLLEMSQKKVLVKLDMQVCGTFYALYNHYDLIH